MEDTIDTDTQSSSTANAAERNDEEGECTPARRAALLDMIPLANDVESEELSVECPFCRHGSLSLKLVTPGEAHVVRSYDDSPAVVAAAANNDSESVLLPCGMARPSPLKVGDSFEKMRAKMVPLESSSSAVLPTGSISRSAKQSGRPPVPPRGSSTPAPSITPQVATLPNSANEDQATDALQIGECCEDVRQDVSSANGLNKSSQDVGLENVADKDQQGDDDIHAEGDWVVSNGQRRDVDLEIPHDGDESQLSDATIMRVDRSDSNGM